jgi:urease accessory protein
VHQKALTDADLDLPAHAPGSGSLHVVCGGSTSVVTRAFASSPLRLLTPRNHGRAAWVYSSTYGGGLVDGDAIRIDADVGSDATALLATQAATKVYRSPAGTSVELAATVGAGGLLVVAPDPVVCFAGSTYRQRQRFDLEHTAGLVCVDWFTSGRRASGERWQFDRYVSRLTIRRQNRPVLIDAVSLSQDDGDVAQRMGRFDTMAVVVVTGPRLHADAERILARVAGMSVGKREDLLTGASPIGSGCILRIAGTSAESVGRVIRDYLEFVPALLGDDPWARKW